MTGMMKITMKGIMIQSMMHDEKYDEKCYDKYDVKCDEKFNEKQEDELDWCR